MCTLKKYPKTFHLPWSLGVQSDDKVLKDISIFHGEIVVVTEKLDGANITMYYDNIHARSLDSRRRTPDRAWVKAFHSKIKNDIPEGMRICGENLFARHSISYNSLDHYFQVFAIFQGDVCLSWAETVEWCQLLGLQVVPVLYIGPFDEQEIKKCMTGISKQGGEQEGYVVRNAAEFNFSAFQANVAKFVRAGHNQTGPDWTPNIKNSLK